MLVSVLVAGDRVMGKAGHISTPGESLPSWSWREEENKQDTGPGKK